jgi:hypothetical protein
MDPPFALLQLCSASVLLHLAALKRTVDLRILVTSSAVFADGKLAEDFSCPPLMASRWDGNLFLHNRRLILSADNLLGGCHSLFPSLIFLLLILAPASLRRGCGEALWRVPETASTFGSPWTLIAALRRADVKRGGVFLGAKRQLDRYYLQWRPAGVMQIHIGRPTS